MTKEEIEKGCGHWDYYTSSNLSDCQKGNLCDKCSAKLEGYESAKKEILEKIDKIGKKYTIKSSDGGFPIKPHIGFSELKSSLGSPNTTGDKE